MPAPETVRDIIVQLALRTKHASGCDGEPCYCGLLALLERAANILVIVEHERALIDRDLIDVACDLGSLRQQLYGGRRENRPVSTLSAGEGRTRPRGRAPRAPRGP